uniref:Uncharacterized protein n=2 Tax=Caenorhabditis japonica TaxID=281687 RepID=A0A8R1EQ90_CAEJA
MLFEHNNNNNLNKFASHNCFTLCKRRGFRILPFRLTMLSGLALVKKRIHFNYVHEVYLNCRANVAGDNFGARSYHTLYGPGPSEAASIYFPYQLSTPRGLSFLSPTDFSADPIGFSFESY